MKNKKIINIARQKLIYLNYSKNTCNIYAYYIEEFISSINKQAIHLNAEDFQLYLENYNFSSVSKQNQVINAMRFLYREVLEKKYNKVNFKRPRKEHHLPRVIDKDHILISIEKISNLKHKAIITLAYSVGLRVSEILNMKIEDIDSKRMVISILQAKGRRDRIVPLTDKVLFLLRIYFKKHKPKVYLFNGQKKLKYSQTSCNKIVKKYLGESYHFHLLRHSCFTHLTEQGVDIRAIQKLAGHKSSRTTEIYTHVSNQVLHKLPLAI